jgi:hypothetical protein
MIITILNIELWGNDTKGFVIVRVGNRIPECIIVSFSGEVLANLLPISRTEIIVPPSLIYFPAARELPSGEISRDHPN